MSRVAITGAGGFVGRHLVADLLAGGHTVRAMVRDPTRMSPLSRTDGPGMEWVAGDVTDPASLGAAFTGCDAVVHLAAIEFERGALTFARVHVTGAANVADAAVATGARRVVYLGQISPGNDPSFRFTHSKWLGEVRLQERPLDWTILRAGVIVGPGDHFVREMARLARFPLVPLAGMGTTRLQPVAVWDVVRAITRSLDRPDTVGATLDVAGPERVTYRDLAQRTLVALGTPRPLVPIPLPLLYVPAAIAAATFQRPPLTPELLRLLARPNVSEANALPDLLGTEPMALDPALLRTAREMASPPPSASLRD